jgi:mevalonate pyrophosphate decarboxylase
MIYCIALTFYKFSNENTIYYFKKEDNALNFFIETIKEYDQNYKYDNKLRCYKLNNGIGQIDFYIEQFEDDNEDDNDR